MRPILRIGLSALIAYCGTIETSWKRNSFIALRRRAAARCRRA